MAISDLKGSQESITVVFPDDTDKKLDLGTTALPWMNGSLNYITSPDSSIGILPVEVLGID